MRAEAVKPKNFKMAEFAPLKSRQNFLAEGSDNGEIVIDLSDEDSISTTSDEEEDFKPTPKEKEKE